MYAVSSRDLESATRCAAACGVTRVAELTRLDRLGVFVCQAVRPFSRALSVHQGKGTSLSVARLGAMMEAVESHTAEHFEGESHVAAFEDLPVAERATTVADFASGRERPPSPSQAMAWTPARGVLSGRVLWVPWQAVSLDLTEPGLAGLERTSNGLAAGFRREAAALTALCEFLERDAVVVWKERPEVVRALDAVEPDTLPDRPWLRALLEAARASGIGLALFAFASVVGWPVVVCVMTERNAGRLRRGCVYGSACRPEAEHALHAAVTEAAQTRLTEISGARDDIPPGAPPSPRGFAFAPPLPPGLCGVDWRRFSEADAPGTAEAAAERLARLGYPQAALVDLPNAPEGAVVVKAFVPGLGAYGRRRRPPSEP